MKRRIATERLFKIIQPDADTRGEMSLIGPQEWPISPITIVYLKIPSEKMKSFCLHKTGFGEMLPLFRAVLTFCSTNRLFKAFLLGILICV